MLKNYILIALRKLNKRKSQAFINILGLMLGITVSCLLFTYVYHELSFDKFHHKSDRIYRVIEISETEEDTHYYGQTAPALGPTLVSELPEVEDQIRLFQFFGHVDLEIDGKKFHERKWFVTESNFFDVFDFSFLRGDKESAFKDPNSVILTENMAMKYFGTTDVIGKTLSFVQFSEVKITGVIQNIPSNSHIQFDLLFSKTTDLEGLEEMLTSWDYYGAFTYLVLSNSNKKSDVEKKGNLIVNDFWRDSEQRSGFYLQSVKDIYLQSGNIEFGITTSKGNTFYINLFLIIALVVLVTASINYTNLATAQSIDNSHEIGVRKTCGAEKRQLVVQYLVESVVTALFAFVLSIILIDLLLPHFNQLTGRAFKMTYNTFVYYFGFSLAIALIIGFISGAYPALYLSSLKPITHFRKESGSGKKRFVLRKILVITQFTLSVILIIIALAAFNQLRFIKTYDKGFDEDKMLIIDINSGNVRSHFQTMKNEFLDIPGVEKVAVSSRVPGEWKNIRSIYISPQSKAGIDSTFSYFMCFDEDMLGVYNIKLYKGSYFKGNLSKDSTKILLNQTAVNALGLDNPVGTKISISGVPYPLEVIGIVKDFNFQSLHEKITPLVIGNWDNPVQAIDYFSLKLNSNNYNKIIADASKIHEKFDENTLMEYNFLDQQLNTFYQSDKRAGDLFISGSLLAIFIACMGLFGMAINSTEKRMSEIGIRKAFGSSAKDVVLLLTGDFIKLVVVSIILAIPVSLIFLNKWLQNFAYNTGINWWVFAVSTLLVLIIAVLTVGSRVLRAAKTNPAKILRDE